MKKIVLCSLCILGCTRATHSVISSIDRVVVQDADALLLLVRDPITGTVTPRKLYAEDVSILFDVPSTGSVWVEYVDAPGEFRGEGDHLILHVRSIRDIE